MRWLSKHAGAFDSNYQRKIFFPYWAGKVNFFFLRLNIFKVLASGLLV